jgi:hypothetical protein
MDPHNYYIRGLFFYSYADASNYFGVDHNVAMKQIKAGAPIDMIFGDRPALIKTTPPPSDFSMYINRIPVKHNAVDTQHIEKTVLQKKQTETPALTFKSLRVKHPYYSKRFNQLHKFIDENASTPKASLFVVNGKKKMLEDIRNAINGRWLNVSLSGTTLTFVHLNDIQDVSSGDYSANHHGSIDINILNNARFSGMTVVDIPGGLMPNRLQSSLGNLLRRRINLDLPTILLTDKNFTSSLEHYEPYLDETISEYGGAFTIIDINPAKFL